MTEERRDFYVYVLFRADGVTPFYVGKGMGNRVREHAMPSHLRALTHKARTARKVVEALGRIPTAIPFFGLTEHEAHSAEAGLIASLGRVCDGSGLLCNLTIGGEGTGGLKKTEEMKAVAREAASKPETRRRKSESQKAAYAANPERRAENNDAIRLALQRPEVRLKISEGVKRAFADPEKRASISAERQRRALDPEWRAKVSAATRAGIAAAKARREAEAHT